MRDKREFEQLTDEKRWKLHELRGQGCSMRECGRKLGCNVSTVSRELSGKSAEVADGRVYLPDHAILITKGRRSRCHPRVKMNDPTFRKMIVVEIQKGRSPETIAGRLKLERGHVVISPETLYDFIYDSEIGKRDKLYEYLPRGKKRRSKKKGRKSQRSRLEGGYSSRRGQRKRTSERKSDTGKLTPYSANIAMQ